LAVFTSSDETRLQTLNRSALQTYLFLKNNKKKEEFERK